MSAVLFISDLHLCEERPETVRALLAFLRGPARGAAALYILGDLFEYWAGDDDDVPLHRVVAAALAELSEGGTPIYFIAGNRDFLLGERYAREARLQLLPDPSLLDIGNTPVLLSHGDMLCTDDEAYQAFRRQVRDPAWQRDFLRRPLDERRQLIEGLRRHSDAAKREKAMEIMDVNTGAVEMLLRQHGYPTLIHGHTHRPACHLHVVDGHARERWVLPDWHDEAKYLRWQAGERPVALSYRPPSGG